MELEDYIIRVAKKNDVALVVIGRTAGEDEDNKNKIRDAIEESQKGIYLVNDVISCNDELSDDDDL